MCQVMDQVVLRSFKASSPDATSTIMPAVRSLMPTSLCTCSSPGASNHLCVAQGAWKSRDFYETTKTKISGEERHYLQQRLKDSIS